MSLDGYTHKNADMYRENTFSKHKLPGDSVTNSITDRILPHMVCPLYGCMGWLRLVGSLKLQVSFAKEAYKRDDILQKRPIILRSHPIYIYMRWIRSWYTRHAWMLCECCVNAAWIAVCRDTCMSVPHIWMSHVANKEESHIQMSHIYPWGTSRRHHCMCYLFVCTSHMDESCHNHGRVTHMNESHPKGMTACIWCLMSVIRFQFSPYASLRWMGNVTHTNESHIWMSHISQISLHVPLFRMHLAHEWVTLHIWMSHVTRTNKWHIRMSHMSQISLHVPLFRMHFTHEWVTSRTYEWVTSHIQTSDTYEWVTSRRYDCMYHRARMHFTHGWVMSHSSMSHVTLINESCHTHQWVMSHSSMSHVTLINESCHTHQWVMSHSSTNHVPQVPEAGIAVFRNVAINSIGDLQVQHQCWSLLLVSCVGLFWCSQVSPNMLQCFSRSLLMLEVFFGRVAVFCNVAINRIGDL